MLAPRPAMFTPPLLDPASPAAPDVAIVRPSAPASPASSSSSFTRNDPEGVWKSSSLPVPFVLARSNARDARDVGNEAGPELDVALRTWPRASCTSLRLRFEGERDVIPGDDGINAVFFHDDVWPAAFVPGATAQTIVTLDADGNIHDADIHLNAAEFRFSLDGAAGTVDLQSVLVHEIGHAIGLGHSNDARATMAIAGSGLRRRSIEADDVDGVCTLYPGTGTRGCDEVPCPAGFRCIAATCQRPGARADVCATCDPENADTCEAAGDDARCVALPEGHVCGRGCANDSDCGRGFACRSTTEAGDLQCVPLGACHPGASGPTDAGADAASDAATDTPSETPIEPGGGCTGASAARFDAAPWTSLAFLTGVLVFVRVLVVARRKR